MSYFAEEIIADAKAHAKKAYPLEACGVIVDGRYHPMTNAAADPAKHEEGNKDCLCQRCSFAIDPVELAKLLGDRDLQGVFHSHPDGPFYPSALDMQQQMAMNIPWVIIATDGERVGDPVEFGDTLPIAPLLGRKFMHGVFDCYSLVRDVFRLGKEGMADFDPAWPYEAVTLYNLPREDNWWSNGQNFYLEGFEKAGFRRIEMSEARPGDAFLCRVPDDRIPVPNHAGVLLSNSLIIHHLPGETRVSRREPVGGWGRLAEMWLRFHPELVGDANA